MKFTILGYDIEISMGREQTESIKKKQRATGFSSKPWTKEDIAKLQDMVNRELTSIGMARMLSRTRASIYGAIHRFKIVKQDD